MLDISEVTNPLIKALTDHLALTDMSSIRILPAVARHRAQATDSAIFICDQKCLLSSEAVAALKPHLVSGWCIKGRSWWCSFMVPHKETIVGDPSEFENGVILPGQQDLGVHLAKLEWGDPAARPKHRRNSYRHLDHPCLPAFVANLEECCPPSCSSLRRRD